MPASAASAGVEAIAASDTKLMMKETRERISRLSGSLAYPAALFSLGAVCCSVVAACLTRRNLIVWCEALFRFSNKYLCVVWDIDQEDDDASEALVELNVQTHEKG